MKCVLIHSVTFMALTLLMAPLTHADMWCSVGTADLYCTDSFTRLPTKYRSQAQFIESNGGLANYSRFTHADTFAPVVLHVTQPQYRYLYPTPVGPIDIRRERVRRSGELVTHTDTVYRVDGREFLRVHGRSHQSDPSEVGTED